MGFGRLLEHVWWTVHAWGPGWVWFQIAAVALGALLVWREGGVRLIGPFLGGSALASLGAIALGSGAEWALWLSHGRRGPVPELEIAGLGAIAGLVVGHGLLARVRGISVASALDALAPAIGAMIAVARLGCFFAGCDFGSPSDVPWALRYPPMTPAFRAQVDGGLLHEDALHTLSVHPTQLYEVMVGIALLVAVFAFARARHRFALAILLYAGGRIVVDMFRGDLSRSAALGLTTTQGLALALAGGVIAWTSNAHAPPLPRGDRPSSPESRRNSPPTAAS